MVMPVGIHVLRNTSSYILPDMGTDNPDRDEPIVETGKKLRKTRTARRNKQPGDESASQDVSQLNEADPKEV